MTIDIDAIRQRVAQHTAAIGPGGEKAWYAGQLATDVPALLAKVDELTEKIERRRLRLVEAENDLLDVRGILSPNGYPRRVPVDLVPTVAPAVRWLADRVDELTAERDQLAAYNRAVKGANADLRAELAEAREQAKDSAYAATQARVAITQSLVQLAERDAQLAKSRTQAAKFDDEVSTLTVEMGRDRTDRDRAAKTIDTLRDYILGAIEGDGLDAAEMHDIAGDLAAVLGHLGHPVANEDGCDCESYDCKGQCCGVGNCTCTPARPIVTVELPSEVTP